MMEWSDNEGRAADISVMSDDGRVMTTSRVCPWRCVGPVTS